MDMKKFMGNLKGKDKQTIRREKKDLQNRQAFLRKKKETLQEEREALREKLYAAMKAKDETSEKVILKQIDAIRDDIQEINAEQKINSESIECYSKVEKNSDEGKSSVLGTLFTGVGTGAAIWLGHESLKKAYQSDIEGTLVNKKSLDVFNRLNPLKLIHFKK